MDRATAPIAESAHCQAPPVFNSIPLCFRFSTKALQSPARTLSLVYPRSAKALHYTAKLGQPPPFSLPGCLSGLGQTGAQHLIQDDCWAVLLPQSQTTRSDERSTEGLTPRDDDEACRRSLSCACRRAISSGLRGSQATKVSFDELDGFCCLDNRKLSRRTPGMVKGTLEHQQTAIAAGPPPHSLFKTSDRH
jgi:hypothetical protein